MIDDQENKILDVKSLKPVRYESGWFDSNHQHSALKEKSVKGGISTTLSQLIVFGVNTFSMIILARVLLPSDFGMIAMVAAFAGFVTIFKDAGFSMAIIQKPAITHQQVSILFWINILLCLVISLLFIAVAPLIVSFYNEPRLFYIILVYAVSIFVSSLSVQHNAILSRKMQFTKIAMANVISSVLAIGLSIVMAWAGAGYWALVYLTLFQSVFLTILLFHYCRWKPSFVFWDPGIKHFLNFGAGISGFNIINYFSRNMDNIIIGKFLGATVLGLYSKAYQLMMMPLTKLRDPLVTVGIPGLSALLSEPSRYRQYYYRLNFIICFFAFPMILFLALFAKELIFVVLGPQWGESVLMFQVLSVSAFIQPIVGTTGAVFISSGKSTAFFKMGLVSAAIIISSFFVGIRWGVYGVTVAYAVANYLLFLPTLFYCFKGTPIQMMPFLKKLLYPACHAAVFIGFMILLRSYLGPYLKPAEMLLTAFVVGVPFYYLSWFVYAKGKLQVQYIDEIVGTLYKKFKIKRS